jgi:hypothetical protein
VAETLLAKHGADALQAHRAAVAGLSAATDPPLPGYVVNYLVQARLGVGVPFSYLVPDEALVPIESIRFFTVDENWCDALMEGILAVGGASTRDTEHVAAVLPALKKAIRHAVPLAAGVRRRAVSRPELAARAAATARAEAGGPSAAANGVPPLPGPPPVTGLVLRSALVSGYPGFSVRAFTTTDIPAGADPSTIPDDEVVPILRLEQIAPSVLVALFAGTPQLVWIEEPHHGVQLGVDVVGGVEQITPVAGNGEPLDPPPAPVDVPMRTGPVPKVIDIAALASSLGTGGSAALATQLLRPPFRLRFSANPESETTVT